MYVKLVYKFDIKFNILSLINNVVTQTDRIRSTNLLCLLLGEHQSDLPIFPSYSGGGVGTAAAATTVQLPRLQPLPGMSDRIR